MWYQGATHFLSVALVCFGSALSQEVHRDNKVNGLACWIPLYPFFLSSPIFSLISVGRGGVQGYGPGQWLPISSEPLFTSCKHKKSAAPVIDWYVTQRFVHKKGSMKKWVNAACRHQICYLKKTKVIKGQPIAWLISSPPLISKNWSQRCTVETIPLLKTYLACVNIYYFQYPFYIWQRLLLGLFKER